MLLHHFIGISLGAAFLWALWVLFGNRGDDRAAGVQLGQVSPEEDSFHHEPDGRAALRAASPALLRVCGWCDGLLHDEPVTLWPRQKITLTHGICPRCQRRVEAEGERIPATILQPVTAQAL